MMSRACLVLLCAGSVSAACVRPQQRQTLLRIHQRQTLLRMRGGATAAQPPAPVTVTTEDVFPRLEEALGEGLKRLYFLPTYSSPPARAGGRGNYEFSKDESLNFVRIVRAMRHVSLLYTFLGVLQVSGVVNVALAKGWSHMLHLSDCIGVFWQAYLILAASTGFEAIAETTGRVRAVARTAAAVLYPGREAPSPAQRLSARLTTQRSKPSRALPDGRTSTT